MNQFQEIRLFRLKGLAKTALSFFSLTLFVIALVACSATDLQGPQPVFQNDGDANYLFELELQAGDTIASLSHEFQAEVIVWEPEDNFAILASAQKVNSEFLPQSLGLDVNQDVMQIPVSAQGLTGWASGLSGWAVGQSGWATGPGGWATGPGGWASGSGGWAAGDRGWMVGHNGWGLGVNTAFLEKNKATWEQIGLFGAHKASGQLGLGTTVAVIDTGVDLNHPMIKDSLVSPSLWRDYYDNDNIPQDASEGRGAGHGTAVAGIILQIAPQTKILPIRILGPDGVGDMDNIILAIRHAVKSGANIINISIGSFDDSRTLRRILEFAKRRGVYIVAAGGNTGQEDQILYPARFATDAKLKNNVFSIGSVDNNDKISDFSASGNNLFAYAPGENIRTAFPDNRLADVSGTSFATPIMAGSLALVYDELRQLQYTDGNVLERLQGTLEKDRIETKYGLDSLNRTSWKYSGGITDINALLHLLTVNNPSFESGLTSWSSYKTTLTSLYTGKTHEKMAKIDGGGYVIKRITGLQPNTTYQIKFKARFHTNGQEATMTISNQGNPSITKLFAKKGNSTKRMKYIKIVFKTGSNNTSATLQINNPSSNNSIEIDAFKLRIKN